MRLVLDTNIIVAALRSLKGGSAALLRRVRAGEIRILLSVPPLHEDEAVALRPEHLQAAQIAASDVTNVLDVLACSSNPSRSIIFGARGCGIRRTKWFWRRR